jgi:hypothetical protein
VFLGGVTITYLDLVELGVVENRVEPLLPRNGLAAVAP